MVGTKEIRNKIKSIQNTCKITKAMEMVAASKMRRIQERLHSINSYTKKIKALTTYISNNVNKEYYHPFINNNNNSKKAGIILITTDKGLCGSINTNILRAYLNKQIKLQNHGIKLEATIIGYKGYMFLNRLGLDIKSYIINIGNTPSLEKLREVIQPQINDFTKNCLRAVYLAYTSFTSTMKQNTVIDQLLPIPKNSQEYSKSQFHLEYIYEPNLQLLIDNLLKRYIESIVYNALSENIAAEQFARMVAMKSASDNATTIINEIQLLYNKNRQSLITKEISEIVSNIM